MQARVPPWRMLSRFWKGVRNEAVDFREIGKWKRAYRVLLLDIKLEVDGSWASGGYAKLLRSEVWLVRYWW
jgi:hypothetical protein